MIELNKNILIAFSGGCFSGKTTTLNKLSQYLSDRGYPVEVIKERAREFMPQQYNGNIDLLRKNAKDYLKFEIDIISKKIQDEDNARTGESKKVYLIDRALTDSLFYLETYIDIKSLDIESAKEFTDFHKKLINRLTKANYYTQYGYDIIFEFGPIENCVNNDTFRPSNIDAIKYYEHNRIAQINNLYYDDQVIYKLYLFGLNAPTIEDTFEFVRNKAERFMSFYQKEYKDYDTEI